MPTKRKPTVDDAYDQKQRANASESAMSLDDATVFENAREAVTTLKKTFDTWIVIGRAVVRAREIADRRGGGKTFKTVLEQQDLGFIHKSTLSCLERIMESLPAVVKWHETLQPREQIDWAAPRTIIKRCPVFASVPEQKDEAEKPLTKTEQTNMALANALERVAELETREDGDRFKATDTPKDIATVLVSMFTARKAKQIAECILEMLQRRPAKEPQPQPQPEA
jgi:hypothetical protein